MNKNTFIACAVFTGLLGSTSNSFAQPAAMNALTGGQDLAIPAQPLLFANREDAEKALVGYNYALTFLQNGQVQANVSGLNGSGLHNPMSLVQAESQKSLSNTRDAAVAQEDETPFPSITLKQKVNGQAAIEALGDQLPQVAKAYDMSPERLENILKTDLTAWIDEGGRLLYVENDTKPVPAPAKANAKGSVKGSANAGTVSGGDTFSTVAASSADPFTLHSKPDSNRVIYLDFNSHVANNTAWYNGTLNAQAYDTDGNPAVFSTAELNNIREIWQRVAEDYAPFDVDVTTQEPAIDRLQRTSSTDTQYGTRAVITRSIPELCGQACGGVAYVNVFSYYSATTPDRYQPAWIFFDKLGNGYPKYVAEAVSHEVGHNLNLNHDGTASVGYYSGQGSGATGWAPIMGVGYNQPVTQWSKGEYSGANNLQDDITVIDAAGATLRVDDYPNTAASAAPLGGDASAVLQTGIIERNTDVDVFTFSTTGGNVQFTVAAGAIASASNLDIAVKLLDASGNTVATVNPANSLSASLSATLAAGQYFLVIEGVGYGDLTTGYSDYASLGQYQISGSYPGTATTAQAPTAVISALPTVGTGPLTVTFNGSNSTDKDGSITAYSWNYGDGSVNDTTANVSHVYNTPGTYTATLTVTDNSGLKNSATQTITVNQAPTVTGMTVGNTSITRRLLSGGKSQCIATVSVKYGSATVSGATVYGTWSGSIKTSTGSKTISGNTSGNTSSTGSVNLGSSTLASSTAGTCAFKVTKVVKTGYAYDGSGQITGSYSW